MAEKIMDSELLKRIVWDDAEGYEVIKHRLVEQTRWAVLTETVFLRDSDDTLFLATWRKAATEMQEHEYPDEAVECEAYTETVTKYRKVA